MENIVKKRFPETAILIPSQNDHGAPNYSFAPPYRGDSLAKLTDFSKCRTKRKIFTSRATTPSASLVLRTSPRAHVLPHVTSVPPRVNPSSLSLSRVNIFSSAGSNTDLAGEIIRYQSDSTLYPPIPLTVGPLTPKYDKTKLANRVVILFLDQVQLESFLEKFHESNAGNYEVLQSRVLGLDRKKADQLNVPALKKLDFAKGEVPCIGLDLCGEGLNDKVGEKFLSRRRKGHV